MFAVHGFRTAVRPAGLLLLVAFPLLLAGCRREADAVSEDDGPAALVYGSNSVENGRMTFERYCASCHGDDGKGAGPVAAVLKVPVPDLTALRSRYNGPFPADSVYAYIDGRREVEAHGSRTMPVWGNVWGMRSDETEVDLRIRELVEYLRSIQTDSTEVAGT